MGVLKLFVALVTSLTAAPTSAIDGSLDELVTGYPSLAYIGNRKSLEGFVSQQAEQLNTRILLLRKRELDGVRAHNPSLTRYIEELQAKELDATLMAEEWFGSDWSKSSGVFPDYVLGLDLRASLGNGALLELKDSKGASIASFNSTIPTRFKSFEEIKKLTGSTLVTHAVQLFDFPLSSSPTYLEELRPCFYLVRTHAGNYAKVRISLVEGSFFETLPKDKLLQAVWGQLLDTRGIGETERDRIVEILSELDQSQIAQSREIKGASIRPRLRLMAEAHPDGNIHRYSEIGARTVNLVLKREHGMNFEWLTSELEREGVSNSVQEIDGQRFLLLQIDQQVVRLRVMTITHKRNGEHLVLQVTIPA